jgi:dTDP-4-amino-4,6-dideoxygalactose transaminase
MTSGEGGAIACMSEKDADWYRSARHHGISKNAASRYTKRYEHWDMEFLGWKYNMDDIQAALLINQIDRLNANRKKRQGLESLYRYLLAGIPGLELLEPPDQEELSGHHLFTVLLPRDISRDKVLAGLNKARIGCAVNYRAVHTLAYFRKTFGYHPSDFPFANDIGNRTISLPLYSKLSRIKVKHVCDVFRDVLKKLIK